MAGRSTTRGLFLLAVLGLAFVSVRPVAAVEGVLDHALMPVRVLSELTRPVSWLTARQVRAANLELRQGSEADYERRRALFEESARAAVPDRPDLLRGRRFVHAEVIDREEDHTDRIVVELEGRSTEGIEVDMPVVSGDVYVGRVREVDSPGPGLATVDLVTGRDFFVGAVLKLDDALLEHPTVQPLRLVVGGVLAARRDAGFRLAVHNPSRRVPGSGVLFVDENLSGLDRFSEQARGFELGRLRAMDPGARRVRYGVEPRVDYRAGLFQVVIACPADVERRPELPSPEVLEDGRWVQVLVTSSDDPSRRREGLKLGAGTWNDVQDGAAVVFGSRLMGRVRHAGPLSADVGLLGDPGLRVPALARVEGVDEPLVLGNLVSLGRDPEAADGRTIRFRWDALLPWQGADGTGAEVFTGSGELLIPRGLLLGTCTLPSGPGPHVLSIEQPVDIRRVRRPWVRLPPALGGAGAEMTP